eukprot:SAG11_NODE_36485_length_261_cov_0.845679_1_plen_32_part_01
MCDCEVCVCVCVTGHVFIIRKIRTRNATWKRN